MSAESHFARVYGDAVRLIRNCVRRENEGLVLSIDAGGSFLDCVASDVARMGHRFVQCPSLVRYRSRVWDYGTPLKAADIIAEPVVFGRVDGWMMTVDDSALVKSCSLGAPAVATRSIDRWSSGRPALRLIHFGDPSCVSDQLEGANETLSRIRPVVTLYPPPPLQRAELLSFLKGLGYQVVNVGCSPVDLNISNRPLDFGWIAVPLETQIVDSPRGTESDDRDDLRAAICKRHELMRSAVPRQRRSGDVFDLGEVGPPELRLSFTIGEVIIINDCYPIESEGGASWRWLGPKPRSRVGVPCAFPGTYRFDVSVVGCRVPDGIPGCRVLVEGREVATTSDGNDRGRISFVGYVAPADYRGYAEIDFVNAGSPAPAGHDPRMLRMNLTSIGVQPCI